MTLAIIRRFRRLHGFKARTVNLENMSKRRGKTRISGSIGGGFNYPEIDVDGKKIKIIGANKTYETKTDKDGIFEIYDLPPGKYFVEHRNVSWLEDRSLLAPLLAERSGNRIYAARTKIAKASSD
jgi:hypothetical protein